MVKSTSLPSPKPGKKLYLVAISYLRAANYPGKQNKSQQWLGLTQASVMQTKLFLL